MALESSKKNKAQDRRTGRQVAFLLFAALVCGGCASREAKAEKEIRSIQAENTNAKELYDRGRAYAFVGDQTRAEEYLTASLDAGGDAREILPLLLDVCIKAGRYRSAIQHGEDQLRKHPNDGRTRLMIGALYVAINEPEHAKVALSELLERPVPPPETLHGEAHYYLAVVARNEHDPVEADKQFREYIRIEPRGSHVEEARESLMRQMPTDPVQPTPVLQTTGVPRPEGATP